MQLKTVWDLLFLENNSCRDCAICHKKVVRILTVVFAGCSFTLSLSFSLISHAGDSPYRLDWSLLPLVFFSAEAAFTDAGSVSVQTTFKTVTTVATLSTQAAPVQVSERKIKG